MATRLAILVEVVSATDTKPRKWKASVETESSGKRKSITIGDDHDNPELKAAIALMQHLGWGLGTEIPLHKGSLSSSKSVFVFENPQEVY